VVLGVCGVSSPFPGPLGERLPGLPAIAPVGPFALQAAGDAGQDPGDGGGHIVRVRQEEDRALLSDETQGVRDVAAHWGGVQWH